MTKEKLRVSLYSARYIPAGEMMEPKDIAIFEDDKGLNIDNLDDLYGCVLTEDLEEFRPITADILH